MKKYLIISDAGSMHVYNFIKCSLLNRDFDITILSHATDPLPERNIKLFEENNIKVIHVLGKPYAKSLYPWSKFRKMLYKWIEMRKLGKIDICHIHFLHIQSCWLYLLNRWNIKHLILTYWGSDILLNDPKTEKAQERCFPFADVITLSVAHTLSVFKEKFVGGASYASKTQILRFVGGALEDIHRLQQTMTTADCKRSMNIDSAKYVVTIGYNALPAQHQDVYIQQITSLPDTFKERVHLIIPLQYGRTDKKYIDQVKDCVKKSGYTYTLLENYMVYEDMAKLSLATDVYINARETDAFSNAMKEMLYAGAYMIQASWLKYQELDDINWPRGFISNADELPNELIKAIEHVKTQQTRNSCAFVWDTWSPQAVRKQWGEVFYRLFKDEHYLES